jgi:hypothetical protein
MITAGSLLPLLGGMMMGVAVVYLFFMLRDSAKKTGTAKSVGAARSQLLVGFAVGAITGAYAIARFVQTGTSTSIPMVILGAALGVPLAYIFASSTVRPG